MRYINLRFVLTYLITCCNNAAKIINATGVSQVSFDDQATCDTVVHYLRAVGRKVL